MKAAGVLLLGLLVLAPRQDAARFGAVDIYVDAGEAGLAAWQVELRTGATLVGVEGGDGAFAEPAFYDPAALHREGRIVLAAFTLAEAPPSGRVRVSRVHVRETAVAEYAARSMAAAAPGGKSIEVKVQAVRIGD
jgi:hypothetical protein